MLHPIERFTAVIGLVAGFVAASGAGFSAFAQPQKPLVDEFVLRDTIQPVTSAELIRAISRANSDGAQALLVEMDTPGGLLDSTRTMAGAILDSRVPVIVYVAPAGARAGSAGFFLLEVGGRGRHGARHQCGSGAPGARVWRST